MSLKDLRKLLIECHDVGYLTEEFAEEASLKALIYINRTKRTDDRWIKEEALSHFHYKLVRKWRMIDFNKSPFSYINRMASNSLLDILKRENLYHHKQHIYLEIVQERIKKPAPIKKQANHE